MDQSGGWFNREMVTQATGMRILQIMAFVRA
jgi:hypothetical protein